MIISVIFFILFGRSMFNKTDPFVVSAQKYINTTWIDLKNYPIVISILSESQYFHNPLDYIDIELHSEDYINGNFVNMTKNDHKFVQCENHHLAQWQGKIPEKTIKKCLFRSYA